MTNTLLEYYCQKSKQSLPATYLIPRCVGRERSGWDLRVCLPALAAAAVSGNLEMQNIETKQTKDFQNENPSCPILVGS